MASLGLQVSGGTAQLATDFSSVFGQSFDTGSDGFTGGVTANDSLDCSEHAIK